MSLQKQMFKKKAADNFILPSSSSSSSSPSPSSSPPPSFSPLSPFTQWKPYFDHQHFLYINNTYICIYESTPKGEMRGTFVLLHGAGFTAMTWGLVASNLANSGYRVFAIDLRGHGSSFPSLSLPFSFSPPSSPPPFSPDCLDIETFVRDTVLGIVGVVGGEGEKEKEKEKEKEGEKEGKKEGEKEEEVVWCTPRCSPGDNRVVIVGHSLGGSIAAKVVESGELQKRGVRVDGVVLIDVVEETSLQGLPKMKQILRNRPQEFFDEEEAIEWAVRTKFIRNRESAQISIPSQLRRIEGGGLTWLTDLQGTENHWRGWFTGLSETFLRCGCPKFLMIGTHFALDPTLMIGQMQGKFMIKLLTGAGHCIQEDQPGETSCELKKFCERWRRVPSFIK